MLTSDANRTNDAPASTHPFGDILVPDICENDMIERLLALDAAYGDDLLYLPLRNSNSYVHGLLRAAGLKAPNLEPSQYPGWQHPLSPAKFGK